jgi:probable F420-dependent oxidoreductase
MDFGICLPQFGPATLDGVTRSARQAEDLGFADVWVSDHVGVPVGAPHPPAFLLDALTTLSFAAAATQRIGLGTSVLVLPLRHPVPLAKQVATLDALSGERVRLGVGAGWLEGEFDACGVPFMGRGARMDESLDVLRACWGSSPASFAGPTVQFEDLRMKPLPQRPIPVWVGGHTDRALRRAIERGDGWQGTLIKLDEIPAITKRLRSERPEEEFTLSYRIDVSPKDIEAGLSGLERNVEGLADAGIQHVVVAFAQRGLETWLSTVDKIWESLNRLTPVLRREPRNLPNP